ncbi:hypothetical protein ACKWTF_000567 [Chironomus riparius]
MLPVMLSKNYLLRNLSHRMSIFFFIFSSSLCIHVLKWLTTKNNNIFLNKNMRTFRKIPRNGENSSDIHAHTENIYDELLAGLEYFKAVFEYFIDLLMDDDGILGKTCK